MTRTSRAGTWTAIRTERAAFTLLELTIVLVILGILAGVVIPRLNLEGGGRARFRQAVSRFRSVVVQARDRAAYGGTVNTVHLELATGRYYVTAEQADGKAPAVDPVRDLRGTFPEGVVVVRVANGGGEAVTGEELTMRFHPQGWADAARIYLATDDDRRTMLEITLAGTLAEFPERTW